MKKIFLNFIFIVAGLFPLLGLFANEFGHNRTHSSVEASENFLIQEVKVDCGPSELCQTFTNKWKGLEKRNFTGISALKTTIKFYLLEGNMMNFSYKLVKGAEVYKLLVRFDLRPIVSEVQVITDIDIDISYIKKLFPLREGEPFFEEKVDECKHVLKNLLKDKGHYDNNIHFYTTQSLEENEIYLYFKIDSGPPIVIEKITVINPYPEIQRKMGSKLLKLQGGPFDLVNLRSALNDLTEEYITKGHYFNTIEIQTPYKIEQNKVQLKINAQLGDRYIFTFTGNEIIGPQELKDRIKENVKKESGEIKGEQLENIIISLYEEKGIFESSIKVKVQSFTTAQGNLRQFHFLIQEGKKIKIDQVRFYGAKFFSEQNLQKFFYDQGSVLIQRGFFDKKYVEDFKKSLEVRYLKQGHVFFQLKEMKIKKVHLKSGLNRYRIEFYVEEGRQSIVRAINIRGISENLRKGVLLTINNKLDAPFNSVTLSEDLDKIQNYLKNNGYYDSRIINLQSEDMVKYSEDFSAVSINVDIFLGKIVVVDKTVITGLVKTKKVVILREIPLKRGQKLTTLALQKIQSNLSALGLFSNVDLEVIDAQAGEAQDNSSQIRRVNLLIKLREKNAGVVELAPGFRTDLGVKLSAGVVINNIQGMNRTVGLNGQVNQKVDARGLDGRRRNEDRKKLEFALRANYYEPYLFHKTISLGVGATVSRKRYFSFDADALRSEITVSKSFSEFFSTSLQYQIESITQSDATNLKDSGHFRIGSMTPALYFDWRDSQIRPRRGSYLQVAYELASPLFLSQDKVGREIKYSKLTSRNKFYYPHALGTWAFSLAGGVQRNLLNEEVGQRHGIPSIKLFRLNGIDQVRGFTDDEINRLENGRDIQEIEVKTQAYFINIKVEPRFFIDENFMLAPFFDAGRLYVDNFTPLKLRSSVGLSFKYLTPVGSLDFDYGFKLERKRLPSGQLERPGEFHVSIGIF